MVAALPQASSVPQPNVGDTGRGINAVPIPANPADPSQVAYAQQARTSLAPAPAAPPPDPYAQYINAFNASLASSRAGIDRQLQQALGELGARRDAASQVIAGLPGQVASSYNMAMGNLGSAQNVASAGMSPDVKGSVGGLSQPFTNALAMEKGTANALTPFLNLGALANYQSGQAALNQQGMIGQQNLDDQARQFQLGLLNQQAQRSQTQQDRTAQWAHDEHMAQLQHGWNVEDTAAQNKAALNAQPTGETALAGTGLTNGQVESLRTSGSYSRFKQAITNNQLNPDMIVRQLQTENPHLLALLQAENPDYFKKSGLNIAHSGGTMNNLKPDFSYTPSPVFGIPFGALR